VLPIGPRIEALREHDCTSSKTYGSHTSLLGTCSRLSPTLGFARATAPYIPPRQCQIFAPLVETIFTNFPSPPHTVTRAMQPPPCSRSLKVRYLLARTQEWRTKTKKKDPFFSSSCCPEVHSYHPPFFQSLCTFSRHQLSPQSESRTTL